ncbi:peptide deformylase, mitochondrial isoform X2 [Cephus cinctus]|uniref:Peptide deformylase n=1 Tax=Cephus cinctus TaxID=211228 RepID=A0AAJ7REM4_CEPCN|nr:peptide deformylase, mitochondrial isoform X2 [Cephus cinctus]
MATLRRILTISIPPYHVMSMKNNARSMSFHKLKIALRSFWRSDKDAPVYGHICQVGDPVLRTQAMPVEPEIICTKDFQALLGHLKDVMKWYNAVGLAAPQIGLPWQIFAVEVTKSHLKSIPKEMRDAQGMEEIPFQVFINPTLRVTDYTVLRLPERCESIRGYSADVPRSKEVEVTALTEKGKSITWIAKGWSARIVQHEYDHLQV